MEALAPAGEPLVALQAPHGFPAMGRKLLGSNGKPVIYIVAGGNSCRQSTE